MKPNPKRYICIILLFSYAVVAGMITVNIIIDPFEAVGSNYIKPIQRYINQRMFKTRTVDQRHKEFNAYIMGSSRALGILPAQPEAYIPGARFYNLSVHFGTISDQLILLEYMVDNGYAIDHLLIQVDIYQEHDAYNRKTKARDTVLLHRPDLLSWELKYTLDYAKAFLLTADYDRLVDKWRHRNILRAEIRFGTTGVANWVTPGRKMAEDYEKYMADNFIYDRSVFRTINETVSHNQQLVYLQRIKAICIRQSIACVFTITPENHFSLDRFTYEHVSNFLRGMAQITDYWDFSGYNSVTVNNHNYYETSHYREKIIPLMFARVWGDALVNVADDFGVHITKENVDSYLKGIEQQFLARDEEFKRNQIPRKYLSLPNNIK